MPPNLPGLVVTVIFGFAFLAWNSLAEDRVPLPGEAVHYVDLPSWKPPVVIDRDTLGEDVGAIEEQLAILTRYADLPNRTRSQMVVVGLTINPENQKILEVNQFHQLGKRPPPGIPPVDDLDQLGRDLVRRTLKLNEAARQPESPDSLKLAGMLIEICHGIYPDDFEVIYAHEMHRRHGVPVQWHQLLRMSTVPVVPGGLDDPTEADPSGLSLSKRQTGINGLLIRELRSGGMMGKATRMSATWLKRIGDDDLDEVEIESRLRFNQEVGEMMQGSLDHVSEYLAKRHGAWLERGVIEFAFQDKFTLKDGDSAGLACALMLEGLATGNQIDPYFTCTGAIDPDGSVRAIGGVLAKLRGAQKSGNQIVVVPEENYEALTDMVVLGRAADLARMQVFTVESFDQAWRLSQSVRDSAIEKSIEEFGEVQEQFAEGDILSVVKTAQNRSRLDAILRNTPNHASARLMVQTADRKLPRTLSFNGSVEEFIAELGHLRPYLDVEPFGETVMVDGYIPRLGGQSESATKRLNRLATITHPKVKQLGTAIWSLNEAMNHYDNPKVSRMKPGSSMEIMLTSRFRDIISALESLAEDPDLNELVDPKELKEKRERK